MVVESRSVIRNAKNARGLGRDRAAAIAPFPKSCPSYFRFARFNTFPLNYLRAWHRLGSLWRQYFLCPQVACSRISDSGEDAKVKGTRKVGGAKKRKRKEEIPTANIVSTTRRTTLC